MKSRQRSFICSDKLWYQVMQEVKDYMSLSEFIRQAIEEKLIRFKNIRGEKR
jgi:hypothetical protein